MKCINCDKDLNKMWGDRICKPCRYDPLAMMSYTDVKKKYKLTADELDNADIFYISFTAHNKLCTKYLVKHVEKLVYDLTKDLDDKDPRKRAFEKQKRIMDEMKIENSKTNNDKKIMIEYIKELLLR